VGNSPGRPTKLTPELQSALVELLTEGVPISTACESVGIDPKSYRDWMRWGQAGNGKAPYAEFSLAIARARSEAQISLLRTAKAGDAPATSNGIAKCAQWTLERLWPKQFAPRVNVRIEEELEGLLDVVERICGSKDCGCYQAVLGAIAARAGGEEAGEDPGAVAAPVH
jgi:transposase-like protein